MNNKQMLQSTIKNRTIFCRDNLDILQNINSNTIDLIYLDPPFNKKKVFTAPIGSSAEGASFKDYFREEDVKDEWLQTLKEDHIELYNFLNGVKNISSNKHYLYNHCYLAYMTIRLIETHRILKDTGSIYFHCDPTMSHYIKLLMDIIFGEKNFRNEIVWHYQAGTSPKNAFKRNSDIIFFYAKKRNIFERQKKPVVNPGRYKKIDQEGRRFLWGGDGSRKKYYLDDGQTCDNVWTFLQEKQFMQIRANTQQYTGYPTQKPLALLERIIKASSHKSDIVLDPFCGCATTCIAAEKLDRQWVGIDVSVKAYELVKARLMKETDGRFDFNSPKGEGIQVHYTHSSPQRTDGNKDDDILKKYVYVISNPAFENMYKVGIASNYQDRLNSYQTSDPDRGYHLEHKKYTALFRPIEQHIHVKFENKHEWVRGKLEDIIQEIENYEQ